MCVCACVCVLYLCAWSIARIASSGLKCNWFAPVPHKLRIPRHMVHDLIPRQSRHLCRDGIQEQQQAIVHVVLHVLGGTELHFSSENPVIYWLNFLDAHFMTLCEEGIRWLTWVWGMGSYFSKKTGHPKRSTLICAYMMKSCWIHEFAAVNHGIHHQFHRLNPRLIAINHY